MEENRIIGIDVGGSHIAAGLIDISKAGDTPMQLINGSIDPLASADSIMTAISHCIREILREAPAIRAVGVAFPGPFDYEKGVSAIAHVGRKFEQTFGLHVGQVLKDFTGLPHTPFLFSNDAHCFAEGAYHRHQLKSKRTVFLTLGTGFGSAFMENGRLLHTHEALPASGAFYDQDFAGAKADDLFSTRWILNAYQQYTGEEIASVKELATSGSRVAVAVFDQLGKNLGAFLLPWLEKFQCDTLVIGGNISRASALFTPALMEQLGPLGKTTTIVFRGDTEACILTGAALIAGKGKTAARLPGESQTTPSLFAATSETGSPSGPVYNGLESLAEKLQQEKTVIIDGDGSVLWEEFREQLHPALQEKNKKVFWYDINVCRKSPEEINSMMAANLNSGKRYDGSLSDFFDETKLEMISPDPAADLCIIYGTGAALAPVKGILVYVDTSENDIKYRLNAG